MFIVFPLCFHLHEHAEIFAITGAWRSVTYISGSPELRGWCSFELMVQKMPPKAAWQREHSKGSPTGPRVSGHSTGAGWSFLTGDYQMGLGKGSWNLWEGFSQVLHPLSDHASQGLAPSPPAPLIIIAPGEPVSLRRN